MDWAEFFLNDALMSRRPWLHRANHDCVDRLLAELPAWTKIAERRHPEEFAARFLAGLRGIWGVPRRNPLFSGRAAALEQVAQRLRCCATSGETGVSQVELVGLGGVGKTQLAVEFAYRHFGRVYGLVVWISAETPESIAAGLRRLALDCGVEVLNRPNAEVVEEVKARLYRTRCPWLLVFDNLEDPGSLAPFLPRGAQAGSVLVTTRRVVAEWMEHCVRLDCFDDAEAMLFLRRAAGEHARVSDAAGGRLAETLGRLPLALAMAAAYMRVSDLTCECATRRATRLRHALQHHNNSTTQHTRSTALQTQQQTAAVHACAFIIAAPVVNSPTSPPQAVPLAVRGQGGGPSGARGG